jgi:hypothetical protein
MTTRGGKRCDREQMSLGERDSIRCMSQKAFAKPHKNQKHLQESVVFPREFWSTRVSSPPLCRIAYPPTGMSTPFFLHFPPKRLAKTVRVDTKTRSAVYNIYRAKVCPHVFRAPIG